MFARINYCTYLCKGKTSVSPRMSNPKEGKKRLILFLFP